MLKLYRQTNSPQADAIESELKDILLAYDLVEISGPEARAKFGPGHSLPILTNNERVVSGEALMRDYLIELRQFMKDWQAYQGDWCYVDDNGETC